MLFRSHLQLQRELTKEHCNQVVNLVRQELFEKLVNQIKEVSALELRQISLKYLKGLGYEPKVSEKYLQERNQILEEDPALVTRRVDELPKNIYTRFTSFLHLDE